MTTPTIVALAVGNSRTRVGLVRDGSVEHASALPSIDAAAIAALAKKLREDAAGVPVVLASVHQEASDRIENALAGVDDLYRIGRDLEVPIVNALEDDSTVGQDRLLCALGAFSRCEQACVVIDAGTAVTVDFVDGEGVFQGGVIAPGLRLMLRALHEGTSALPSVELKDLPQGPFGKTTREAMLLGALHSVRGLVRTMIEQYATAYEAYPQIVATGGDAMVLFENDDVVEHIVPELQLLGIGRACEIALND